MTSIITVSNLDFDYPNKRALNNVSIDVPRGAVLALVGPNGAGKSTLMRVIAGLDEPVSGSVLVDGINVLDEPRLAHRKLGYLADFFGLYDELTVAQCLMHAASIRAVPPEQIDAAVKRTAEQLGLADRLLDVAGTLSRGLKQRLAVGQALIHRPTVLLLDEPAAGLDPEARASLSGLFRELQASGMTLLISSHILAELEEYSTHMLAIRDGRVASFSQLGAHAANVNDSSAVQRIRIVFNAVFEPLSAVLAAHNVHLVNGPPNAGLPGMLVDASGVPVEAPGVVAEALGVLVEAPGVSVEALGVLVEAPGVLVEAPGGSAGAAQLLVALVGAGAQVCEFSVQRETLQDSYLRSVQQLGASHV